MESGRPDWAGTEPVPDGMEKTIRLWPHKLHGEGHFLAVLEKQGKCRRDTGRAACMESRKELRPRILLHGKNLNEKA